MTSSLKSRAVSGLFWSAIENFGTQIFQLFITIILARLLLPSDFGLIGMLAIFIAIAQSLIDSGFKTALIQKKDSNDIDFSTVFYFNIFVSIASYFIVFLASPLIAEFYNEPKLVLICRVVSLNFVLRAFSLIQITILTKNVDFKTQSKVSIISIIFSGSIGIVLAFLGLGVWALVFQSITNSFVNSLLFWILHHWRPLWVFSIKSFKSLFGFGSRFLLAGLIETFFQNVYYIIIGRYFNADALGYYVQAKKIQALPVTSINKIIQRVTFPIFATIQDDNIRLKYGYKKALKISVFILFPIMFGLQATADSFVYVVLSEKWANSIIYIKLLCISGLLYPLHTFNLSIITVKGRSDLFLRLEIIKKCFIVIAIIVGIQWGVLGLVLGIVVMSFVSYFINAFYSGRMINYNLREQLFDIFPYFIAGSIMAIFTNGLSMIIDNMLLLLFTQLITAPIIYYSFARITQLEAYCEIQKIIVPKFPESIRFII